MSSTATTFTETDHPRGNDGRFTAKHHGEADVSLDADGNSPAVATETAADVVSWLRAYDGDNVWEDVIRELDGYDSDFTGLVNAYGYRDRFATADGDLFEYADELGWVASDTPTQDIVAGAHASVTRIGAGDVSYLRGGMDGGAGYTDFDPADAIVRPHDGRVTFGGDDQNGCISVHPDDRVSVYYSGEPRYEDTVPGSHSWARPPRGPATATSSGRRSRRSRPVTPATSTSAAGCAS